MSEVSFVGRGFAWPLQVDHTGSLCLTAGADDLDRSMRVVLLTAPGERVMRPEFGCAIWDLMFEPVTPALFGQIEAEVREALTQWEPRIDVLDVVPFQDDDDPALVHIDVSYRVKATNDRRNLVHPFYVIPREEG